MADLKGQVAIVSGGLGDIGRAIALVLAKAGADVAVGDVLPEVEAKDLLGELRGLKRRARYDRVDVTDAAAVARWVAAVESDLGPPTLIIPNAAIVKIATFVTLTPEQWDRELQVNLSGAFYLAQAAVKGLLKKNRPGRVVFIGSWAADAPHPNIPTYCVSKAGLRMLCQSLALELAPHDILVNEVAPGYVNAGLSGKIFQKTPGAAEAAAARVPIGRLIEAEEVALQVLHLCDPANRHMSGSTLLMDGGLTLSRPGSRE